MAQRRSGGPYIWATTLAKLLAGENSCEWAGWFKAHHQHWAKPLSDFDSAAWMLEHTALVNREREERGENGLHGHRREPEPVQAEGQLRHPGGQAGPHSAEGATTSWPSTPRRAGPARPTGSN